jgi:hypothetical protein
MQSDIKVETKIKLVPFFAVAIFNDVLKVVFKAL